jgi:hypothetical protein
MSIRKKLSPVGRVVGNAALVAALVLMFASLTSGSSRELAARVDRNAAVAAEQGRETRDLICSILVNAQTPEIRQAVREHCPRLEP